MAGLRPHIKNPSKLQNEVQKDFKYFRHSETIHQTPFFYLVDIRLKILCNGTEPMDCHFPRKFIGSVLVYLFLRNLHTFRHTIKYYCKYAALASCSVICPLSTAFLIAWSNSSFVE